MEIMHLIFFPLYKRESASIYISKYLLEEGATLNIFDPKVASSQIIFELSNAQLALPETLVKTRVNIFSDNVLEACRQAHAIVICTEWDIFQVKNIR